MTLHEWAQLVVDLIKALAWPVAVGLIAWRSAPAFLTLLSGRAVDVQGFGIRATIRAVEQQITTGESPTKPPALEEPVAAQPVATREAVQLLEQKIREDLRSHPNREAALINALASVRLQGQHEWAYNRIFGSQIAGLRQLDELGGANVAEARQFFEHYEKQFPEVYQNYGFDSWLGFMTSSGLVERSGDRLTATPFGHDFLIYLREARLTEAKAG